MLAWIAIPPIALIVPDLRGDELLRPDRHLLVGDPALHGAEHAVQRVPDELVPARDQRRRSAEAARIDGANVHQIFGGIMLPLARPALATLAVFNFLFAWNEFIFALLLLHLKKQSRAVGFISERHT